VLKLLPKPNLVNLAKLIGVSFASTKGTRDTCQDYRGAIEAEINKLTSQQ